MQIVRNFDEDEFRELAATIHLITGTPSTLPDMWSE
jgi:hypothetical protein